MESVVVETSYGAVQGTHVDGVDVFRGIPYARPPVGELRFAAPQPPEPWSETREATEAGPCCYVADTSGNPVYQYLGHSYPRQDEDCLNLNIWTPGADGRRRPVMVWIHGGAFVTGSGSLPMYDGEALCRNGDVVVVTINYRLGAFGFLRLGDTDGEGTAGTGNEGLLDQVAALEWVHNEIGAFGGDATNITVFGESAGAISISAMLSMPETTGLFQKAILQSGAPNLLVRRGEAGEALRRLLADQGLPEAEAWKLRELPAEDLHACQERATPRDAGMFYGPIAGTMIPEDPYAAIAEGSASGVSVMIGTNLDEMRFFLALDERNKDMDEERALKLVTQILGGGDDARERAENAMKVYRTAREERGQSTEPREIALAIATDWVFRFPAMRLAELQSRHVPVYCYLFDWPSPAPDLGAAHLVETPFVFGTYGHEEIRRFAGDGEGAAELSAQMQDAWVRFARFGSPTTQLLQEWPPYEPVQRWTMRLGPMSAAETLPLEAERQFWSATTITTA